MEIEKCETEKILQYLQDNLQGHPTIDGIIAGVFIAEDFTKMENVVDLLKKARSLMDERRLKKDDEIILVDQMVQKLYKYKDGDLCDSDSHSEKLDIEKSVKTNKRELKAARLKEEEKEPSLIINPISNKNNNECHSSEPEVAQIQQEKDQVNSEPNDSKNYNFHPTEEMKEHAFRKNSNELQNLINKHDENSIVKSFTILCTWDQLMD